MMPSSLSSSSIISISSSSASMMTGPSTPAATYGAMFALRAAASSARPCGSSSSSMDGMGRSLSRAMPGNSRTREGYRTASSSIRSAWLSSTSSFHSKRMPFRSAKSNAPRLARTPKTSTRAIAESGMGIFVQHRRLIFLPVARFMTLYVPCSLPVGPRMIPGLPRAIMEFVGFGSSWVST